MLDFVGSCFSLGYLFHVLAVYSSDFNNIVLPAKSDSDVMFCLQTYKET